MVPVVRPASAGVVVFRVLVVVPVVRGGTVGTGGANDTGTAGGSQVSMWCPGDGWHQ